MNTVTEFKVANEMGEDMEMNRDAGLQSGWAVDIQGGVRNYFPYKKQIPASRIPAGSYDIKYDRMQGVYFAKKEIASDKLIAVEDSAVSQVLREVHTFVARKAEFVKRGFLYKRGIMLLGAPGSGKSSTINMVAQSVADDIDGLVLYMSVPAVVTEALQRLRSIEPDRLVLMVMEDIDSILEEEEEETILSLLDGENQVNNVIYIATTNYPERLPDRICDRPSRFDTIVWIDAPTDKMRAEFLKEKEPEYTFREIEHAVKMTEGFTVSHLKEFIILNRCFGHSIETAARRILNTREKNYFGKKKKEKDSA